MNASRQKVWEEEYCTRRYLIDVSDEELNQRLRDVSLNLSRIDELGRLSIDTRPEHLDVWSKLITHVFMEYGMRTGIPQGVMNDSAIPYVTHPKPPNGFTILNGSKTPTSDYLVKLGQKEHMQDMFEKGSIRIAPASSYADPSLNSAIQDEELSFNSIALKSESKMTLIDKDGKPKQSLEPLGNITITHSAMNYYVYCMTYKYDYRLLDDFGADAMVLITNPKEFGRRFIKAVKEKYGDEYKYLWIPVYYADPFNIDKDLFSIYFAKHFRFSYQNEYRFLMIPKTEKDIQLDTFFIKIGKLDDVAKFYSL